MIRVALNTHVSWWRERRREVAWDEDDPAHDRVTGEAGPHLPDDGTPAALRSLPRRQREVVALRLFLDLDTHDTAQALGIAPHTVSAHLARATATLRTALAPDTDQDRVSS